MWSAFTLVMLTAVVALSEGMKQFQVTFVQKRLIGGPFFVPLHRSVLVKDKQSQSSLFSIDFIPKNPLEVNTIVRLLTFQNVQGEVRLKVVPTCPSEALVNVLDVARSIQREYDASAFHLLFNNCYTFADGAMQRLEEVLD